MDNWLKLLLVVIATSMILVSAKAEIPRFSLSELDSGTGACQNVDCQAGTCIPLTNVSFPNNILSPYECQCNQGWTNVEALIGGLPSLLTLPCTVPNCTLNLNCSGTSPALTAPAVVQNVSSPCLLPGVCGNGACEITDNSTFPAQFKCVCDSGYSNVGNLTAGYCLSSCALGASCSALGITLSPASTSPTSSNQNSSPSAGWRHAALYGGLHTIGALVLASAYSAFDL